MINPFELIESRLIRIEEMIKNLNKMSSASTTHDNQNFFHVSDIARMYKINVRTLYKYHHYGKISLKKFGGKTYVAIAEIEKAMVDRRCDN